MKKHKTRNVKRRSNLGTIDAIHKVLCEIFWAKQMNKPYSIDAIATIEQVGSLKNDIIESLYDWSYIPSRELAEECRERIRNYQDEHWGKKKAEPIDYVPDDLPVEAPLVVFAEDPVAKEAQHCNDFGILTWNGHRYRLVPID